MADVTTAKPAAARDPVGQPVIVDLGKHARKDIKQLREGRGKLIDEITNCVAELKQAGTVAADAQTVVVIVRQKRRKNAIWPLG